MMNLSEWHSTILSALAFLKNPAADFLPPPASGTPRQRLEALGDLRRLLQPADEHPDVWRDTVNRLSANVGDAHRHTVAEALERLARAIDAGIASALDAGADDDGEFVRTADFGAIRFFVSGLPLAVGSIDSLPAGHRLRTILDDHYRLEGNRVLILGPTVQSMPLRARPFYPLSLAVILTRRHRQRQQAEEEAEARRRQVIEASQRAAWANSPEGLLARLEELEATRR